MSDIKISERKQKILKAVVDNYIVNPQPVSSNEIRDRYLPDVSSATIRGELCALEELGYLVQPHVSAGRIPSGKAYRFYVDTLDNDFVKDIDLASIKQHFNMRASDVEEVVRSTARVISDITNYTTVVVMGRVEEVQIKEIKLVDVGENSALVIIITDSGILKDKIINLPSSVKGSYFIAAGNMLNNMFAGKMVKEVLNPELKIQAEMEEFRGLCDEIIGMVSNYKSTNDGKVYLEGANKIFDYKEYENMDNVKNFLSLVNTKEDLKALIGKDSDIEMYIRIGKEEGGQENMAIITAKCIINGKEVGHAGVIGPERMDYKKVISVLSGISKVLDDIDN